LAVKGRTKEAFEDKEKKATNEMHCAGKEETKNHEGKKLELHFQEKKNEKPQRWGGKVPKAASENAGRKKASGARGAGITLTGDEAGK